MDFYQRALEWKGKILEDRRFFHQTAEVGLEMPKARDYVLRALADAGIEGQICGHGVSAVIGTGSKSLLLRADMDALPMAEESGLPFACSTGHAHACGHDCHAAMLLAAAKLLKEQEGQLGGMVRLMFQPAEETLEGCRDMIAHGILEPKPDGALAVHVAAGSMPPGTILYNDQKEAMMHSADGFELVITGRGGHGAYPNLTVDPIQIGVQIYQALQSLIAREADPAKNCTLTVGQFVAGEAYNIIPETAVLRGSIRTNDTQERNMLVRRLEEVASGIAAGFGGTAQVKWLCRIPPLICDPELVKKMVGFAEELPVPDLQMISGVKAGASEDFALIADQVPSAFFYLSAGFADERGNALAHNPRVQFHEDVLPIGAALLAHCAMEFLT